MTTEGTFDFSENNTPSPAGTLRRRLSVTSAGVLSLTNSLGVTTPVAGPQPWVHNALVVFPVAPYAASIQETVKVDPDASVGTIQLPSASGIAGFQIKVVSVSDLILPPVITVLPAGIETINGLASKTLTTPRERIVVESDGADWLVVD